MVRAHSCCGPHKDPRAKRQRPDPDPRPHAQARLLFGADEVLFEDFLRFMPQMERFHLLKARSGDATP
jgi:hypothetical protein